MTSPPFAPRPPQPIDTSAGAGYPSFNTPQSPRRPPFGPERSYTSGPGAFIPRSGASSPFGGPPRSATSSPRPPLREPSPERQLPQECAFPPFPLPRNAPSNKQRPRGHSQSSKSAARKAPAPVPSEQMPAPRALDPPREPPAADSANDSDAEGSVPHTYTPSESRRSETSHYELAGEEGLPRAETPPNVDSAPPIPPYSDRRNLTSPSPPEPVRLPFTTSPLEDDDEPRVSYLHGSPEQIEDRANQHAAPPQRSLGHFRKPSMSAATRPLHEIGSVKTHRPTHSRSESSPRIIAELGAPWTAKIVDERNDTRLGNAPPVPVARLPPQFARNEGNMKGNFSHSPAESVSSNGSSQQTTSSRSSPPTSAVLSGLDRHAFGNDSSEPEAKEGSNVSRDATHPQLRIHTGAVEDVPPAPLSARSSALDTAPLNSPLREQPPQNTPLQQAFDETILNPSPPNSMHSSDRPLSPRSDFHRPRFQAPSATPPPQQQQQQPSPLDQGPPPPQQSDGAPPCQPQTASRHRPIKSFSRPNYSRPVAAIEPESPMDPALHNGRLPNLAIKTQNPPPQPQWAQGPQTAPIPQQNPSPWASSPVSTPVPQTAPPLDEAAATRRTAFPPRKQSIHLPPGFKPPSFSRNAPPMPRPNRQRSETFVSGPSGSRGMCRGCSAPIQGKSVSSADGRLTGRWHRSCFVCQTCKSPFTSSDFYVFQNQPYCARHYHALNNTLCVGCDRGIEGPYVATDDHRRKFHPHCFTCRVCHLILREVHFEDPSNGSILCERHAKETFGGAAGPAGLKAGGPGGRLAPVMFPERRTTRLMMS